MAKLVVLITVKNEKALECAEAWQKRGGAGGVTILNSFGLRGLQMKSSDLELPLFVSIASVLGKIQETANQTILSLVEDEKVDGLVAIAQEIIGSLERPDSGILFTVPVDQVFGLGKPARDAD